MNNDFEMIKHKNTGERNSCYKNLDMRVFLWSDVYAVVVMCLLVVPRLSDAGGRLLQPAARSSLWRVGLSTTVLYQDHQLSCGGFQVRGDKNRHFGIKRSYLPLRFFNTKVNKYLILNHHGFECLFLLDLHICTLCNLEMCGNVYKQLQDVVHPITLVMSVWLASSNFSFD